MKLNVPGPTSNIPYGVALLDSQGGAVPPVAPEKQPPQIGHLAAEKRGQFRVRAMPASKVLSGGLDTGIRNEHGYPTTHALGTVQMEGGYQPCSELFSPRSSRWYWSCF